MSQLSSMLLRETHLPNSNNNNSQYINLNINQSWKINKSKPKIAENKTKFDRRKLSVISKSRTNKNVLTLASNGNLTYSNVKKSLNISSSSNGIHPTQEKDIEESKNKNLVLTIPRGDSITQLPPQTPPFPPIGK